MIKQIIHLNLDFTYLVYIFQVDKKISKNISLMYPGIKRSLTEQPILIQNLGEYKLLFIIKIAKRKRIVEIA